MILAAGYDLADMDFIYRFQATSDDSPPWAGITFNQAVDSDDLAEQLKIKYPKCRTLRQRKHKATIEFLEQELERMRAKDPLTPTMITSVDLPLSERRQDRAKAYIEISPDRSRPQSSSGYTSRSHSGSIHSPAMSDPARLSTNTKYGPSRAIPNASSQQLVWSSQTGQPMRPKTKRKMTAEERKAYKKTREQGACESCRKQKARCTHAIEGEMLIHVDRPSKPVKRRKSTGSDSDRPKKKPIKDEPPSNAPQIFPEPPQPRRVSAPTLDKNYASTTQKPSDSVTEPMLDNAQWGNGFRYVLTGQPMPYFDEDPWTTFTTRNPVDTLPSGYAEASRMTSQSFSPGMPPPSNGISLSSGFPLYEPSHWMDDQSMDNPEPT